MMQVEPAETQSPAGHGDTGAASVARQVARAALERAGLDGSLALTLLGVGTDSTSFGWESMVVSVRRSGDVGREAELLSFLSRGGLSLATPAVVFVDRELGVIAGTRLPGTSLLGRAAPEGAPAALGSFVRQLHRLDVHAVPHLPHEPFDAEEWTEGLAGPPRLLRRTLEEAPSSTPPEPVLCHGDLGAEHIFETDGGVAGVIDWGDACLADPERDLARILRDFGPQAYRQAARAYGAELEHRRVLFYARCAALEDLAFGAEPGLEAYAAAAERSLAWLFEP